MSCYGKSQPPWFVYCAFIVLVLAFSVSELEGQEIQIQVEQEMTYQQNLTELERIFSRSQEINLILLNSSSHRDSSLTDSLRAQNQLVLELYDLQNSLLQVKQYLSNSELMNSKTLSSLQKTEASLKTVNELLVISGEKVAKTEYELLKEQKENKILKIIIGVLSAVLTLDIVLN